MEKDLRYKEINETVRQSLLLKEKVEKILDERKDEIADIRVKAENFFQQKHREHLSGISVDILSSDRQGIRVAYLKAAGINNMYQLSQLNYSQIRKIEGIGTQGAKKINNLKHTVLDEVKNDVSLRIRAENPDECERELVKAICIFLCREDIRKEIKKLYNGKKKAFENAIEEAEKCKSEISFFLLPSEIKSEIISAAKELRSLFEGDFSPLKKLFEGYREISEAQSSVYMAHFEHYSNFYYAVIEKYCRRISAAQKLRNTVSMEFVREIEKQTVNLSAMKHSLRPYQIFGVKFMLMQKKTLLGDEMGLGKTVQAIGAMAALRSQRKTHFMVICPASVLTNWLREINSFSNLSAFGIRGADQKNFDLWYKSGGVAVTTFDSVSRLRFPVDFRLDFLVVDEAHYVKNPESKRTQFVIKLLKKSERAVYMTGTPLVNRVEEMCFLVSCLQPEVAANLQLVKSAANAEQFRHSLSPVYLRRLSSEVSKELPPLIRKDQWCTLSGEEERIYTQTVRFGSYSDVRRVSWNADTVEQSSKAVRLLEVCDTARLQGRKILVFSFFLDTLEKAKKLLGERVVGVISGSISSDQRQKLIDSFNQAPEGAVLVSQIVAGGVGLNIQSASVVVFCEPQLTPAAEDQALKRAHRMGQTRDVIVYRLIAENTVDERILEIISEKRTAFDRFAAESLIAQLQSESEAHSEAAVISMAVKAERERLKFD